MVSLKIAGDWAPGEDQVQKLAFDLPTVINLEGPVILKSESFSEIVAKKAGPALKNGSLPENIGKVFLSLANNHIMDFGEYGLGKTLEQIEAARIEGFFGAGSDLNEAKKPLIIENQSVSVGILSRCERQFGVANATTAGTAALDSSIYADISSLRKNVDHVVVLLHGGSEMIPWPSPMRRQEWRALIDAGASAVVGNHSHVPSSWETYERGVIFYGLGNFCVEPGKWNWHPQGLWSLAPEFRFAKNQFTFEPQTVVVAGSRNYLNVGPPSDLEIREHCAHLDELNEVLDDEKLLEGIWQEASIMLYKKYFSGWLGFEKANIFIAVASVLKQQFSKFFSTVMRSNSSYQQDLDLLRYHLFACDAHRDVLATALGVLSGELSDLRNRRSAEMVNRMVMLQ